VSPRHRRDFLLDSGAVTALAANFRLLEAYTNVLEQDFDGSLLIPTTVLTEVRTGKRRYDVPVDRLINALRDEQDDVYIPLSAELGERAGVLRTEALANTKHDISAVDAQLVATAENLSHHTAVTILTTDPDDFNLLVDFTRRTNIAVDTPA
jgi:predicted nucleic acid-binding protein